MSQLLAAIICPDGRESADAVLSKCHERDYKTDMSSSYELYFHKDLEFRGFELLIRYFELDGDSVDNSAPQFKRPTRFPAPWLNCNKPLFRFLAKTLEDIYATKVRETLGRRHHIVPIPTTNEDGRQLHFDVDHNNPVEDANGDWGSECVLFDEPDSSGQTERSLTDIRNDFVMIKFQRKRLGVGEGWGLDDEIQ